MLKKVLNSPVKDQIVLGLAILVFAGLFFSPAFQSIGIFLLSIIGLLSISKASLKQVPIWIFGLIGLYLISLVSIFYSTDISRYSEKILVKLPYLLSLPLCLAIIPLENRKKEYLVLSFVIFSTITGLISLIYYFIHFYEINASIEHSKPIPILMGKLNHIYFSVMSGFGTLLLFVRVLRRDRYFWFNIIFLFINLIIIHVIVSRTGVFAFYFGLGLLFISEMIRTKKVLLFLGFGFVFLLIFGLGLYFVPSWNSRLKNTIEDVSRIGKGSTMNNYSLSMRSEALKISKEVIKKHPILGVGEGSLIEAMEKEYVLQKSEITKENYTLPHNQFIQNWATTGILSPIILFLIIISFYLTAYKTKNLQLLCFGSILLFSMNFESIIERQVGITFFILFGCLLYSIPNKIKTEAPHHPHHLI